MEEKTIIAQNASGITTIKCSNDVEQLDVYFSDLRVSRVTLKLQKQNPSRPSCP